MSEPISRYTIDLNLYWNIVVVNLPTDTSAEYFRGAVILKSFSKHHLQASAQNQELEGKIILLYPVGGS